MAYRWAKSGFQAPFLADPAASAAGPAPALIGEVRLQTTPARDQTILHSELCCAYAMAAALETWLSQSASAPTTVRFSEQAIYDARKKKSPHAPPVVAKAGIKVGTHIYKADIARLTAVGPARVRSMKDAIDAGQPLTIQIDLWSNLENWSGTRYQAGGTHEGYHALCVIGYGSAGSDEYWIVKNSFGPAWNGDGTTTITIDDPDLEPESIVYAIRSIS